MGRYIVVVAELAEAGLAISHKARLGVSSVKVVAGTIAILIKVTWSKPIQLILGCLLKIIVTTFSLVRFRTVPHL
eukprot:scaffold4536_cov164-Skeletonema_dohrnii-CCMP3373.AAC.8